MSIEIEKTSVISELEDKVKELSPANQDERKELLNSFKSTLNQIDEAKIQYLQLLEMFADTDKEFNQLYTDATESSFSEYVDKLNSIGAKRKRNSVLKKAFEGMGYRLMEQTRAGRKDDVFHNLLRLYMTSNQPFDKELLIAFKQPNREMFKVLIFSFLSGIIEPKNN